MSTFNQPSSFQPARIEREKEVPQDTGEVQERPSPEKVSPTQQGKFLGELEKKEKKKETKAPSGETKGEEVEETDTGLFGLLGTKVKDKKDISEGEAGGEEGTEEEGEEGAGEKPGQPPATAPMLPPMANEQAQLHAQAPLQVQAHAAAQNIAQERVHDIAPVGEELPAELEQPEIEVPEIKVPEKPLPPTPKPITGEEDLKQAPVIREPAAPKAPGVKRTESAKEKERVVIQPKKEAAPLAQSPVEKERVAFQPKKEPALPAAQPLPIAPQPEIQIKAKEPTAEEARVAREALIELFKQTVDALSTMVTKAQTTTLVTIKQPPLFEGATLLVTEYSSAKKEYNITFGNLSPDARRLIEATSSQTQLRQALIDKGYTLHLMTIEAQPLKTTTAGVEARTPEGQRKERVFDQGGRKEKEFEGGVF